MFNKFKKKSVKVTLIIFICILVFCAALSIATLALSVPYPHLTSFPIAGIIAGLVGTGGGSLASTIIKAAMENTKKRG
jgi:multidrug transporter EmrE-like cation transporter